MIARLHYEPAMPARANRQKPGVSTMELSQLKSLGEIAGIGGIAFVRHRLIGTIAGLPKAARALKTLRTQLFRWRRL